MLLLYFFTQLAALAFPPLTPSTVSSSSTNVDTFGTAWGFVLVLARADGSGLVSDDSEDVGELAGELVNDFFDAACRLGRLVVRLTVLWISGSGDMVDKFWRLRC